MVEIELSNIFSIWEASFADAPSCLAMERMFDNSISTIAALLAFLELASAIVIFSVASKRVKVAVDQYERQKMGFNPIPGFSSNFAPQTAKSDPKDQPR
jgi:hypothetical protein